MIREIVAEPVPERETRTIRTTLTAEGIPIPKADFTALTFTLHLDDDLVPPLAPTTIINDIDLLTDPRATVGTTDGTLAIVLTADDNQIVDPGVATERHVGLIEGVYGGGKEFAHEIEFTVVRIAGRTLPP